MTKHNKMIYLIGDIAEFKKNDKDNTKRNLLIAGGLLGAGILGTIAVKSYLRNGKLVKPTTRKVIKTSESVTPKLTSKQKLDARRKAINDNVNNNLKPNTAINFDDYLDNTSGGQPTFGDYFTDLKLHNDTIKLNLSKTDVNYAKQKKQAIKKQIQMIASKLRQRNAYYNRQLNLTNF